MPNAKNVQKYLLCTFPWHFYPSTQICEASLKGITVQQQLTYAYETTKSLR